MAFILVATSFGTRVVITLLPGSWFPSKAREVFGPTTVLEFLGIIMSSNTMELRLPAEKLHRLKHLIQAWHSKKTCTKWQLLSLISHLQHASTVIKPGRTFIRLMIDFSNRKIHLDAPLRLNVEFRDFRSDITWWALFLEKWNSVSIIKSLCRMPIDRHITSDASGSWGCETFCRGQWFSLSWGDCPAFRAHI